MPAEPQGVEELGATRVSMTLAEAMAAIESGAIEDAKTILAIYALRDRL